MQNPGGPRIYEAWSLGDHLNNIGFILETIAKRGEVSGLILSDALSQIDIAKSKTETATRWLRLENQRLMDAADHSKRRATRALGIGILIGAAAGFLLGFLFGVTG